MFMTSNRKSFFRISFKQHYSVDKKKQRKKRENSSKITQLLNLVIN